MKTTMPSPFPQTRLRIKPMKSKMMALKLGVGAVAKPQKLFERTSSLHHVSFISQEDLRRFLTVYYYGVTQH